MRYNVGDEVLFINVKFEAVTPRFTNLYLPWEDKLEAIQIKQLTCKEHHRVPGNWDDEIKYDGFIFSETVEGHETLFNNQYPRASYGQIDDSADWTIIDHTDKKDYPFYKDASRFLEAILRGVRALKEATPLYAEALKSHYDDVVKVINELGFEVTAGHLILEKTDGTTINCPNSPHVTITKKKV